MTLINGFSNKSSGYLLNIYLFIKMLAECHMRILIIHFKVLVSVSHIYKVVSKTSI